MDLILAIDQGTSGTSAVLYDNLGQAVANATVPVNTHFPASGWVEQNPHEILASVKHAVRTVVANAGAKRGQIACMGMAHQGESLLLWDYATGEPIYDVISWQCIRSADLCQRLERQGMDADFRSRTGLPLDPTWPSTKIPWVLKQTTGADTALTRRRFAYSQIDTWLMRHLTVERVFRTDHSMASRSGLYNLQGLGWDEDLVDLFGATSLAFPEITNTSADYGTADFGDGWRIPWRSNVLDQAAALYGHGCTEPGQTKVTYGTCAGVWHTLGSVARRSSVLETSIAWMIDGSPTFAYVGESTTAGAALTWLRQQLHMPWPDEELASAAQAAGPEDGMVFIPAFNGLGQPHSAHQVRGTVYGLTAATGFAHILRAAFQAIALGVCDVISVLSQECEPDRPSALQVDGGLTRNEYLMQFQADMLGQSVAVPRDREATARGAALLAGKTTNLLAEPEALRAAQLIERHYVPTMPPAERQRHLARWRAAIDHTLRTYSSMAKL